MAIFGRRQPHQPLILRPTVRTGPAIGELIQLSKAAQNAAIIAHRPPLRPTILTSLAPVVTPSAGWITLISRASLQAALLARRPVFKPILLHPPPSPPTSTAPVGRLLQQSKVAQAAAIFARRPPLRPFIVVPRIVAPLLIPSVGWITQITRASIQAAIAARQPLLKPLIRHPAPPAAVTTPPIGRIILHSKAAQTAALLKPIIKTRILFSAAPPAIIAGPAFVRGQLASLAAALAARRPLFKPLIETRIKFSQPAGPPVGRLLVLNQSLTASLFAHRPMFRVTINRREFYLASVPPVAGRAFVRGQLEALVAAIEARMPFLFRPFFGKPPISLAPPGPPIPGLLGGGVAPLLNRDPVQDPRLRRAMEILSSMYNSLVGRGFIRQNPRGVWSIQTGVFQVNRAPGLNDDETIGVLPGNTWINTVTGVAYINIINTPGAAVWAQIS